MEFTFIKANIMHFICNSVYSKTFPSSLDIVTDNCQNFTCGNNLLLVATFFNKLRYVLPIATTSCLMQLIYPRVTSLDALKQSTDICAHRIIFSSRKNIILNKLSCFQSKHTFREVREHLFCLKYRCQRVYVCRHH